LGSSTVRINDKTLKVLKELAHQADKSLQEILDKAVEDYKRKQFLMEANEAYAALKNDPEKWQEEIKEREEWDIALEDGQEEDQ